MLLCMEKGQKLETLLSTRETIRKRFGRQMQGRTGGCGNTAGKTGHKTKARRQMRALPVDPATTRYHSVLTTFNVLFHLPLVAAARDDGFALTLQVRKAKGMKVLDSCPRSGRHQILNLSLSEFRVLAFQRSIPKTKATGVVMEMRLESG